ncbi:hypothetical protein HPB48_023161 [Haemaphysalis longicornis]|uniref:Uncharacterized protein n=1 Tax=Haemaphysalis longicornis TaxID=44386 RepID=A0A9J6H4K0_HAELO|nr:hypothetical protein HPB48_023161 [Haemaphysalis longicornis]
MALGVHNTTKELIDKAQRIAQQVRLTRTKTGRDILKTLNITPPTMEQDRFDIPREIRERIHVHPLPRHMHPEQNDQVREHSGLNTSPKRGTPTLLQSTWTVRPHQWGDHSSSLLVQW